MSGKYLIENLSINDEGGLDFEVSIKMEKVGVDSTGMAYPVTISGADVEILALLFAHAVKHPPKSFAQKPKHESDETTHPD